MTQAQCLMIQIHKQASDEQASFLRALPKQKAQVRQALEAKEIQLDTIFLEATPDADYLVFYTRSDNIYNIGIPMKFAEYPAYIAIMQWLQTIGMMSKPLNTLIISRNLEEEQEVAKTDAVVSPYHEAM